MKNLYFLLLLPLLFVTAHPVQAAQTPNCQQIYGGGPSCEQNPPLTINKQVQNPQSKAYVDALTPNDPMYSGGQTILYKITINNSGDSAVNNIELAEVFPNLINFSKGEGKYDATKRTLKFTIEQLKGKETKVFFIEGKIAANEKLPDSQQARCVINQARVTANDKSSQDNALVCIAKSSTVAPTNAPATKGGLPIYPPSQTKKTPDTGPETWAFIGLFPLAAFGFFLQNKARLPAGKAKT